MKHILKVAIIFAIIFNCTIFANYPVYAECSHVFGGYVITQTPGVPPQALNTEYAKSADTNPL